jgi:hypothetical protein
MVFKDKNSEKDYLKLKKTGTMLTIPKGFYLISHFESNKS